MNLLNLTEMVNQIKCFKRMFSCFKFGETFLDKNLIGNSFSEVTGRGRLKDLKILF